MKQKERMSLWCWQSHQIRLALLGLLFTWDENTILFWLSYCWLSFLLYVSNLIILMDTLSVIILCEWRRIREEILGNTLWTLRGHISIRLCGNLGSSSVTLKYWWQRLTQSVQWAILFLLSFPPSPAPRPPNHSVRGRNRILGTSYKYKKY